MRHQRTTEASGWPWVSSGVGRCSGAGLREEHQGVVRRAMDSANSAVRRAALAATGLQAPEHLPTPLETQGHPEASVVRWWRKVGPALRDLDGRFDLEPLVD